MTDIRLLDYKSSEELNKHKKNLYLSNIINRTDIIDTTKTINMNIRCFSGFEGHYYYNGRDPLVNTAKELLNNINLKPEESYLFKYYEDFKPNTYGELYCLSQENKLHKLSSTTFFHPWIHEYPTKEYRPGLFGPKHITNVQHRMIRLTNLINNIKNYGYKPSLDDIVEGYILYKTKDDYRFLITSGHHRVAVLTAIHMNNDNKDYDNIRVKFDTTRVKVKIVKIDDINNWPGVKSGYLSNKDALEMFNKYFS